MITMTSLVLACLAIVFIFENHLDWACFLLIGSCFCDFFDGMTARLLNVSNPLGEQLDSLADMAAFGIAPGMLVYKYLLLLQANNPHELLISFPWLTYIAFLIPVMSAYRLALFNIDTRETTGFFGLATPANASFYIYIVIVYLYPDLPKILPINEAITSIIGNPLFIIGLILFLSFMLVANVPMFSLKFKNLRWKGNELRFTFILIWAVLMLFFNVLAFPIIGMLYILWSILNMNKIKAI